jgi:hypothetical protein
MLVFRYWQAGETPGWVRCFPRDHSADLHERDKRSSDGGYLNRTQAHKIDN